MSDDVEALRTRVAEFEAQNRALHDAGPGSDAGARPSASAITRSIVATLLITIGVVLAPLGAVGTWAHGQLVDTDRFVQTFAPLAHDPEVQVLVTSQVSGAIQASIDIDGLVDDLVQGVSGLGLPSRASAALGLLAGPAADGIRSLIDDGVERVVTSPQFAQTWEIALRQTHSRATAILQGDPETALQLSRDGTLSLQLGPIIAEVRQSLIDQGFRLAERIPAIDRSIPLVSAESLGLARAVYQLSVVVGYWLPWVALGLLAAGVAIARQRIRALAWAGAGLTVAFLLLAAGLAIGRRLFAATVSPSVMPATTANIVFDELTLLLAPAVWAMVVLSALTALGAWLYGRSRPAVAVRTAADRGFGAIRAAADRNGLGTGGLGALVDRIRPALIAASAVIGSVVIVGNRPATMGGVLGTLGVVLLVIVIIELLRRPAAAASEPAPPRALDETLVLPEQRAETGAEPER